MSRIQRQICVIGSLGLLASALAVAVLTSRAQDWHPIPLVVVLIIMVFVGDRMEVIVRGQQLSAGFVASMLAVTLLGPAPAVAIGASVMVMDAWRRRPPLLVALTNVAFIAACLAYGAILIRASGDVHRLSHLRAVAGISFCLTAFAIYMGTNAFNFALVAVRQRLLRQSPIITQIRTLFVPMLPGQAAAAALAAILAVAYIYLGYPALLGLVGILAIFQYLAVALVRSEERADQLEARTVRLASLQIGVLATLVETLALRDRASARHAAAVARYARWLTQHAGADEGDQDQAHTAGLLHDIGKFALPDRILNATVLSEDDQRVIRRHPQDGAKLVGRLDGYGPIADAILYHHENVDGTGYPAGLIGSEIPFLSRVLAICNAYDHLTARESHQVPLMPNDAVAELRRVAGWQLDATLVETFAEMLHDRELLSAPTADEANFEAELAFERKARSIAQAA